MHKVAIIFGTRPEAIKMAPIVLAMERDARFRVHVCATAQHRQMLDQVLGTFDIKPNKDLDVMTHNQGLAGLTSKLLESLTAHMTEERPDLVLVQGDTTTVLCAALAGFYLKIPVGHVEAGLRSHNIYSPWPEEANRTMVSRITSLHLAPTKESAENLRREGAHPDTVHVTGNTVVDALHIALSKVPKDAAPVPELDELFANEESPRIVLITGHRRENLGTGFEAICHAIAELANRFPDVHFVYPVHLNPNVRAPVQKILGSRISANIHLLEPISYLPFVHLMQKSTLILTDSGGIQEEAPSLGKPVLVMRDTTERPEGVQAGMVKLVGPKYDDIVTETTRLLDDQAAYRSMASGTNPYGDGKAAQKIVSLCFDYLERQRVHTNTERRAKAG